MTTKSLKITLFFGSLGLLLAAGAASAEQTCPGPSPCSFEKRVFVRPTLPGSLGAILFIARCYSTFLGEPLGCGNVFHRMIGLEPLTNNPKIDLEITGGHEHDDLADHPVTAPPPFDKLVFERTGLGVDPRFGLSTGPVFGRVVIIQHPPDASGNVQAETLLRAPEGFRCFINCFDGLHVRHLTTIDVGLRGLEKLEQTADSPFVLSGETTPHPVNHFGTESTIRRLTAVAQRYKKETGNPLSINDISLPRGGLFDLCRTYNPKDKCPEAINGGHDTHRTGTDADIDQQGVPCLKDRHLKEAVREAGAKLRCESGGRKHVDFD